MNKKKLLPLIMSVALVGAIGVGATLAYFTDSETETNVVTMGNVDIDLDEPNFDPEDDDNTVENITPGQTIVKDPTITVGEDSQAAYIRATIEITGFEEMEDEETKVSELMKGIEINEGWVLSEDGYYYYQESLKAGESATLFDEVVIPENWGNEVADLTFEIIVDAEAIQADNFTPATDEDGNINGWDYKDGTAITVENYDEEQAADTTPSEDPVEEVEESTPSAEVAE